MMKRTLRIALTPFMLIARLVLGLAAFISSIVSAVIGLTVGLFAVLSVIEFAIGYWQNSVYSSKGRPPHNPVLAEYYARKCLSKPIKVAMGAAMHKLCNIIFAVLRNQKPFEQRQPELHAASLGIKVA